MFKPLLFIVLLLSINFVVLNAQCTLTALCPGGNWSSPGTWSPSPGCGTVNVPGDWMAIVIPACANVSVDINSPTYDAMQIYVSGTLTFGEGQKINMTANGYVYVAPGGSIEGGTPGSKINIGGTTVWNGPAVTSGPISYGSDPMPVELTFFTAKANNETINLTWSTQSEKNNSGFEIERSSDAIGFSKVAFIASKAVGENNKGKLDYSYSDSSPIINNSYYRLKQINADKTYSYSDIVSVSMQKGKSIKFTIYPNPNHGEFTADISGLENNHNVRIKLTDIQGKLIYSSNFHINSEGNAKIQIIPETKIPSGIYFCTLILEEIEYKVKVVVS